MATPQELITLIQQRLLQKWKAAHPDTDISANDIEWWKYIQIPRDIKDSPTGKLGGPDWLQALFNDKVVTDRYDPAFERLVSRMASSAESDEALTDIFANAIESFPNIKKSGLLRANDAIGAFLLDKTLNIQTYPDVPKLKNNQNWWDLIEPLVTGGIIEAEAAEKWNTFKSKYVPIVNGKIKLPPDFSPTNGEDLELDKVIIEDIQSNAADIQEALKSLYLQKLRGNPQATDEEMFRILLEGGPSGLSAADISALDSATLLNSLPELLMRGTLDEYRTQAGMSTGDGGGRFPDDAPSWLTEDKTVDPNTGKTTYGKQYYAGTATHPHMVVDRQGQRTYYDKDWNQIAPPREDVGPVAFEPDSRYFERDPRTGEWKLNEALSNLPLGQQAQFDNRFKLAEEAMSNIQKGGQLGINFAAQDLKGREYLDDMLRDPGMSFARMANFRGDPQWKGGRFGGVSPADRFNDYQNYYGGLNKQLRDLYGLQGLFNPPPAESPSITPPATPTTPSGPTGSAGPGGDIGAGHGFKPPEQVTVPRTPSPPQGNFNVPGPPPPPPNQVPGFEYPGNRPPPGFGMDTGNIRSQAIQPLIPTPAVPPPSTATQQSLVENAMSRLPGFGSSLGGIGPAVAGGAAIGREIAERAPNFEMPSIPNIDPGFGVGMPNIPKPPMPNIPKPSMPDVTGILGGAGIGRRVPEMVTDIKETITDIDVPKFIDLPEVTWSGPRFSMPSMPSFNMPNILDSRIVNTIQGQGGRNIERDRRRRAAERASRNTLANAQRGRRGSFG